MNKLSQFWQELKRRKVVRVITVFAAAAFVILELVDIITEPFGLPDWTLKLVVVLLSVGLVVSIILSWIYDLQPEGGIVKTEPATKTKEKPALPSSKGWKITTLVSVVIIIGLSGQGYSQPTFKFNHLTVEDGLSQSSVTCILKDRNGFMWFGTRDGLNRYDSYDFRQYRFNPGDSTTISNNTISCLYEDHLGTIWIGTEGGGLNSYDPVKDRFQRLIHNPTQPDGIPHNSIGSITEDRNGNLWIGTLGGGLSRFDRINKRFTHYVHDPDDPQSLGSNIVMSVIQDTEGVIWLATEGAGLVRFDPSTERFTHYRNNPDDTTTISTDLVSSVFEDDQGKLWVGSWGYGLNIFDKKTEKFTRHPGTSEMQNELLNNNIFSICQDKYGIIWLGTRDGLSFYDPRSERFNTLKNIPGNPYSFSDEVAFSLYYDKNDDILWVGTWARGITSLSRFGRQILHFRNNPDDANSLNNNDVFALFEDGEGILWIGTERGGLNKYDPANGTFIHYVHDPNDPSSIRNDEVMSIHQDRNGQFWIGTFGGGLNKFDPVNETFRAYEGSNSDPLNKRTILSIYEDSRGSLWLTTSLEGVIRIDPSTSEYTYFQDDPDHPSKVAFNDVLTIIEDHTGAMWFGSRSSGIFRLDPETGEFTYFKHDPSDPQSLGADGVYAFHEDSNGNLWIGTRGAGLNILKIPLTDKPVFSKITTKQGLATDWIMGIKEDQNGNIWTSGQGISKISNNTREVNSYFFASSNQGAFHKSNITGAFYLGGDGVSIFHPDSIKEEFSEPQVLISKLSIYNPFEQSGTAIPVPGIFTYDSITLSYRDKILAFEFLSLTYDVQEERQYAYLLENFSKDWIQLGTERKITFTGLSPGKYQLRVKSVYPSGDFGQTEANLSLTILPPWWKSRLAYGSYVVLFILSLFGIISWRTRRLKNDKEALESQVEERTKEIVEQKDEIESQRDEIESQRDQLEIQRDLVIAQKSEIIDSINYAQRIQVAMLPLEAYFHELLDEVFILHKPRDIVSGDFYWIKQVNQYIVLVAADCTGHGVPGALMSMLGISYLNEIVQRREITQANQVLNELRTQIKHSLRQHGQPDDAKDGIDMALCVIDQKKRTLQYSGANNPLYLIRDDQGTPVLDEIKADRMPLGYYQGKDKSFTNNDILLEIGDTLYLFSDGFIDQKGGANNKKFMSKNFKNLLLEIHDQPMYDQKKMLDTSITNWMDGNSQVDDILVVGVRV